MIKIWLVGFPVPPSANAQVAAVNGRLIKSRDARLFDAQVGLYLKKHSKRLNQIKEFLTPHIQNGSALRVDCYVAFHVERLFTKGAKAESWAKTLDANNRLKASLDGLVKCLDIDDKYIFAGNCEKVSCNGIYDEQVMFCIQTMEPRRLSDVILEIAEEKGTTQ